MRTSGKGSHRRRNDDSQAYRDNYDKIFGKKDKKKEREDDTRRRVQSEPDR